MPPTIRVGLCVHRQVEPETLASLFVLGQVLGGNATLHIEKGAYVAPSREKILNQLSEDYLLFVDSDMAFGLGDVDTLFDALRQRPQYGAIAASYIKWDGSEEMVGGWRESDGSWVSPEKKSRRFKNYLGSGEIIEVDSFGAGLLLCSKDALEVLPKPVFTEGKDEGGGYGEDTALCKKLKEAGFLPSIHFGVQIGHVGPHVWYPQPRAN